MTKIKEFKKIEKRAESFRFKQDTECCKMLNLIEPMLDDAIKFEGQFVMYQPGGGYVLVTDDLGAKILQWIKSLNGMKKPMS